MGLYRKDRGKERERKAVNEKGMVKEGEGGRENGR